MFFNTFLERITSDAPEKHQGTASNGGYSITNLQFGDDIDDFTVKEEEELVSFLEEEPG